MERATPTDVDELSSSATTRSIDGVTQAVLRNLEDQHDWTKLEVRHEAGQERPLIRGLPPKLLYLHPDDQIAALAHERKTGEKLTRDPQFEWVLPVFLVEKWSLARFAAIFDSIDLEVGTRAKRIVLATLHHDSTVVYYLMQEGAVKPRQN
ncbi:tRNA-splicing endonuclease subunit Sen15 [Drechmeria coniospora]|uniref:tRNA-splicing endonuclease subunit Sen15 n=1 Tax=Drechmeria coniospora TaxID=98403 RepID=A0A151GBU5_DRECN|nr:tRNA-splicing endonuclease subunit Sen15 [Drechmeria coniospora]KYK54582.1 tRNA-splicing endonuclease subunit Sen15 [Drechmeria coniospora]ODA80492.1 hypothetical protein RJ55_03450 [Drechmeria coniospora]